MSELQSALAAAERVFRLLDETEEPADSTDAKVLTDIYGDVELSHVASATQRIILLSMI